MAARLVVEWTRSTLRMAVADGEGARARVRAIRSQPLGATGETAAALRELLGKHLPALTDVIGVVPREHVITRVVKFPAVRLSELTQMVELYAKAQLPYPREQAVFDFHVVAQQEGFSTVAIVACQRDIIDRQLAILREAGLPASLLTVSSWGVLGWYRSAARSSSAPEPTLVINVDDSRTDLVLIADGRVLSSRSAGQGARDWEASAQTGELLALEIERSRAAVRKELPGVDVRSFVLTGLGPLSQWSEYLAKRLSIAVTAIDGRRPFKEWTSPLAVPISPVVIGGLASSELRGLLNLSPPELRGHVRHRQQVQELVMVSGLLLAVLAAGAGLLGLQLSRERRIVTDVERALTTVEPTAKHVQEHSRSAQLVNGVLEDRRHLGTVLSGILRAIPPSFSLEVVEFERARHEVILRGSAVSTQEVLDGIKQLEQLDGVKDVQLRYSTRRSTPMGERTDFELSLRVRATPTGGQAPGTTGRVMPPQHRVPS